MVSALQKLTSHSNNMENSIVDPIKTANGVYVTIHGHFYQPPRENPYLNIIERQPSAQPFHDWNERIHHECYRPNAFARILNDRQQVVGIVNNFEYLSFNIGATLMSWLEQYDLEVYRKIIEADRLSSERLNGHGNAIAQVYNHIILPLANKRDKHTQIRWGKEDFYNRFGRETEGMWLAETAVDYETIEALIDEEIRFIILAPSQVERCRPIPQEQSTESELQWQKVAGSQIDPTRPYRCFIEDGRYIDIFFYDGPISRDMGFNDVLETADNLTGRLGQAIKGDSRPAQLINVATDGETFGHHKAGTEKCLAYAFTEIFTARGWTVTNYAHYLSISEPTWEVVLKPVTSWSCSHGVDRWRDNCGCGGGGLWHQKWRKPLRESLDWLRDHLITVYEEAGSKLFRDPWLARDDYIQVIGDRSLVQVKEFLADQQSHELTSEEKIDALRLLEMQRHALLMYTSCGWFFEEISRPEGTQILRYASRAIELAGEVAGLRLETEFIRRLSLAHSNVEKFRNGGTVYRQLVLPSQVSLEQVAAHYAINSLFKNYLPQEEIYCYQSEQLDCQKQSMGILSLVVGQVRLTSQITRESQHFVFAAFHLGGWDFHCCIKPFTNRLDYSQVKEELFAALQEASTVKIILVMNRLFGDRIFNLHDIFGQERHRIMNQLTEKTKKNLDQLYTQVYRENYSILVAFEKEGLPVPQEVKVAAEVALSARFAKVVLEIEKLSEQPQKVEPYLAELKAIVTEAAYLNCKLNTNDAKIILEQLILHWLWQLLDDKNSATLEQDVTRLENAIEIINQLQLGVCLARAQEVYYQCLHQIIIPDCLVTKFACPWDTTNIKSLLRLGKKLNIDVSKYL
ncbi:MAG: DUF3536 domain-containing protein [Xenococcus sp. (in: cyanobacteria)]